MTFRTATLAPALGIWAIITWIALAYDSAPRKPDPPPRERIEHVQRDLSGCVVFTTAQLRAWCDEIDAENQALLVHDCVVVNPTRDLAISEMVAP